MSAGRKRKHPGTAATGETRIGGGQDRMFHTNVVRVSAGSTFRFSAPNLSGALMWACYDGDQSVHDTTARTPEGYVTLFNEHALSVDADGTLHAGTPGPATANGMVLIPHNALSAAGNVSVSVAVEGRYVATTRTALSGDVVAAVAGAPELASRSDAFAVAADGVTAAIANAVGGFWYAWEAADTPTGPFAPAGNPVRASLDGELEMSLAEPIRSQRFYRLCVSTAP